MQNVLTMTSTVTRKGQTTIPKAVRDALALGANDQISFQISANGVSVAKAAAEQDPVIGAFLAFLERDMLSNPGGIAPLSKALLRLDSDTDEVDVASLDEEIIGTVAL